MPKSCAVEVVEIEYECSGFTPGATWVYGSEYYSITRKVCVPRPIANRESDDVIDEWCDWLRYLYIAESE